MRFPALTRKTISAPARYLRDEGYLLGFRILDYGSGKGKDAEVLGADSYDPIYHPEAPKKKYDIILCTYVLNILRPEMIPYVLDNMRKYLTRSGVMFVTVRRDLPKKGRAGLWCWQYNHDLSKWGVSIRRTSSYEIYFMESKNESARRVRRASRKRRHRSARPGSRPR